MAKKRKNNKVETVVKQTQQTQPSQYGELVHRVAQCLFSAIFLGTYVYDVLDGKLDYAALLIAHIPLLVILFTKQKP